MDQKTKTILQSVNVLQAQFQFDGDELDAHRRENKNPAALGNALKASITRFWREDPDASLQRVDTAVKSDLRFYVVGTRDEAAYGQRFILDCFAVENLEMEAGIFIKVKTNGQTVYSEEQKGIEAGTRLQVFVDCEAGRGAVLSYDVDDQTTVVLAKPDFEINTDPKPEELRPYPFREFIKESELLQSNPSNPNPAP